jgi:hypothetical protein
MIIAKFMLASDDEKILINSETMKKILFLQFIILKLQ